MPIIEYIKTTKRIVAAHYGQTWDASDWSDYESNYSGQAVVNISDDYTTTAGKYLQINDGVGTLHDTSNMSISVSVSADSNGYYPLVSDNSAYIDFTSVPNGTTITVDEISAGTMDSSGTFRFTAQHAGYYTVLFTLTAYESKHFEVTASDNI